SRRSPSPMRSARFSSIPNTISPSSARRSIIRSTPPSGGTSTDYSKMTFLCIMPKFITYKCLLRKMRSSPRASRICTRAADTAEVCDDRSSRTPIIVLPRRTLATKR
ncbi:hypothetical protein PMAYCL1PPCAC_26724, partial [Pristionchus mayeri]